MAVLTPEEAIKNAIGWLQSALAALGTQGASDTLPHQTESNLDSIAYGAKVSPGFKAKVIWMGEALGCDPSDLMACMAWEDAETFASGTKNAAGSGATGLIQFMPSTAVKLGTTVQQLAAMTPEDQLKYVYRYFQPYAGRLHDLGDVYMAILWPSAIGKTDDFVVFDRTASPTAYKENAGLDGNKDGKVTRGECLVKINQKLTKGLGEGYLG